MAITPEDALARSPKADFTVEEQADLAQFILGCDENLAANFDGAPCQIHVSQTSIRMVAEIARRYSAAGWIVSFAGVIREGKVARVNGGAHPVATGTDFILFLRPPWLKGES